MKINGKNITDYSAKLIDRVCSTQNIESVTDWLDSSVEGTLLRQDYEFKTMKLSFLVTENDEDAAYKQISRLTEAIKKCSIKFDDINLIFPCVLKGAGLPNRVQNGVFKVDYVLLNDWGIGDAVNLSFDIQAPNAKEIKIKYIENWAATAKGYSQCYDNSEIYKTIAEETVYVDKDKVAEVAASALTWNDFFLALGVDINKYKPQLGTLNGFIDISTEYSESAAVALFDTQSAFDIYYNKYQKKGIADLPLDVDYPSLVWTANDNSDNVSFDLQMGKDWNIQDITIYVWGRWFDSNGKCSMFGALGANDYYGFNHEALYVGTIDQAKTAGYDMSIPLKSVKDESVLTKEEIEENGDRYVAIVTEPVDVRTFGTILYISDGVTYEDKKLVTVSGESTAYIVFK